MSLDSILSFFRPTAAQDPALAEAQVRSGNNTQVRGPHIAKLGLPPRPSSEQSDVNGPVDRVQISTQATFVIAASKFDPTAISDTQKQETVSYTHLTLPTIYSV